jgi:hypothetical protein
MLSPEPSSWDMGQGGGRSEEHSEYIQHEDFECKFLQDFSAESTRLLMDPSKCSSESKQALVSQGGTYGCIHHLFGSCQVGEVTGWQMRKQMF